MHYPVFLSSFHLSCDFEGIWEHYTLCSQTQGTNYCLFQEAQYYSDYQTIKFSDNTKVNFLFYVHIQRNPSLFNPDHNPTCRFQTPIRTTLIQPPQKASMTPWILTACWGRRSAAWEGNQFSGTCCLSQRGTSDTSLLFLAPLTTRLPEVLHSMS